MRARSLRLLVPVALLLATATGTAAAADPPGTPTVVHTGQVTRQDVPSRAGSETDTVVEPDVAVNPTDHNNAVAVAHDSRYADGGAVGISAAWTYNGGKSWQHRTVPGITKATGGIWDRASDPVVTFAADGTAYLSVLEISLGCPSAVAVLASHNGGRTWGPVHYAHRSASCNYSDDKNWLVVDNSPASPHFGRLYQFWTPFLAKHGNYSGAPQAVRWSDDQGVSWSTTSYVIPTDHGSQDSQPMVMKDGTLVDTFYDFGKGNEVPDVVPGQVPGRAAELAHAATPSVIDASGSIYSATSTDGGRTWSPEDEVANNAFGYSPNVRCCLFAADIDPVTQTMYAAYIGGVGNTDPVYVTWSRDGQFWSSPQRVSQGDVPGTTRVNVDVVARHDRVYVSYGTRTDPKDHGGYVQQQLSMSTDAALSFGGPMSIGPVSALRYAARAGGYFPGDYIGAALTSDRLYLVWARSSKPPAVSSSKYHQVIWGATLRP